MQSGFLFQRFVISDFASLGSFGQDFIQLLLFFLQTKKMT
jgi:hypothetical protein